MKNTFKSFGITAIVAIIVFLMAPCTLSAGGKQDTAKPKGDPLLGQWNEPRNGNLWTFNSDGTGTVEVVGRNIKNSLTWTVSGDTLTFIITTSWGEQGEHVKTYSISGDTLTLIDSDNNVDMMTMYRPVKEPAQQPTIIGTWIVEGNYGNQPFVLKADGTGKDLDDYTTFVWSVDGNKFKWDNDEFTWALNGNILTLSTPQFSISWRRAIVEATLYEKKFDDEIAKQKPSPPHPPIQPASANPAQPYTLVGTWYRNVTLKARGHLTQNYIEIYTFNSDGTGTIESRNNILADGRTPVFRVGGMSAFRWTVSGNRITFTSLNGDPDSIYYRTYTISGNTLTFTIDGKQLDPHTRAQPLQAPTTNQPPPIGTWRYDSNPMVYTYTFNSDGTGTYREINGYAGTDQTYNLTWSIHEDWLRTDRRTGNNKSPLDVKFNHYSISGNELCFGYFQQIYIRQ